MASYNQQLFNKVTKNLGVSNDYFKITTLNPNNAEVLAALEHNDIDGFESKVFGICFQQVRNQAGPFKVFGSVQNQRVTDCIHKHVNAYVKAVKTTQKQ